MNKCEKQYKHLLKYHELLLLIIIFYLDNHYHFSFLDMMNRNVAKTQMNLFSYHMNRSAINC